MNTKKYRFYNDVFAERIKFPGKTKAELAKLLNIEPQSIDWDKDGKQPNALKIPIIAQYLECDPSMLCDITLYRSIKLKSKVVNVPNEIKSTPDSLPNSPLVNLQITAKEFAMLEEFREIKSSDAQNEALNLIGYWRKLDTKKQGEMVQCAKIGKTCYDGVIAVGEAQRGIAPPSSSVSTDRIQHHST